GHESRHNSTYWRNEPYYGLGTGAHGYINRVRHMNIKGVQPYIEACKTRFPRLDQSEISEQEAKEDFMMVGLRLLEGVTASRYVEQFPNSEIEIDFGPIINKQVENGLMERVHVQNDVT